MMVVTVSLASKAHHLIRVRIRSSAAIEAAGRRGAWYAATLIEYLYHRGLACTLLEEPTT
jgi:hypothetical protein